MGDNTYSLDGMPPLEFDGKLPAFLHPMAGTMIMGLIDRFGNMIKSAIGGAITETTGIKTKSNISTGAGDVANADVSKAPDVVSELDDILNEDIIVDAREEEESIVDKKDSVGKGKNKGKEKSKGGK
jgi:hypothetical protein